MVDTLSVYDAPKGTVMRSLPQYTRYSSPLTLMAIQSHEVDGETWYHVSLPAKPNGQTGWVRASDVTVRSTDTAIHVYLAEHQLDLVVAGTVTMTAPVAVGSPYTPTPRGTFYITDPIDLASDPGTAYGTYALGISGYSDALDTFKGSLPQIAIHGTSQPNLIGRSVSNGCVRMTNTAVVDLAARVGLGTPVIISASRTQA
jgi:lipoprotein-anchoring transpeptidase ErfK/SrfK